MKFPNILDEAAYHGLEKLASWLYDSFVGKPSSVPTSVVSAPQPDQSKQRRDWIAVFFSDHVSDPERENLEKALNEYDDDDRDRFENAMGELISQVRDGVFNQNAVEVIEALERPGKAKGTADKDTKTVKTLRDLPGFEREKLLVQLFRNSLKTPEKARLLINLLLKKSLGQKAKEGAEDVIRQVRKHRRKILLGLSLYVLALIIAAWAAVHHIGYLFENPTSASSLVWGILCILAFFWMSSPFMKLVLPKE